MLYMESFVFADVMLFALYCVMILDVILCHWDAYNYLHPQCKKNIEFYITSKNVRVGRRNRLLQKKNGQGNQILNANIKLSILLQDYMT